MIRLNKKQSAVIKHWLGDHNIFECPACKTNPMQYYAVLKDAVAEWITTKFAEPIRLTDGFSLMVVCSNCNYVFNFDGDEMRKELKKKLSG